MPHCGTEGFSDCEWNRPAVWALNSKARHPSWFLRCAGAPSPLSFRWKWCSSQPPYKAVGGWWWIGSRLRNGNFPIVGGCAHRKGVHYRHHPPTTRPLFCMLQVVRTAQYGCNCRGAGGNGGCGEFDIVEAGDWIGDQQMTCSGATCGAIVFGHGCRCGAKAIGSQARPT